MHAPERFDHRDDHQEHRENHDENQVYLKQWRHHQAYSVHELAKLSGLSRSTITRLETDNRPPRPSTIRALAQVLGMTPNQLRREPPI
jgi:transcriptional regulator with XRE-family HTH domain